MGDDGSGATSAPGGDASSGPAGTRRRRAAPAVRTDATPRWTVCGITGAVGRPDLREPADLLVIPELSATDTGYELLSRPGGAEAIGPVLLGTEEPVHILQRGATVAEIVSLASITVVDAEIRRRQAALDL